MKIVVIPLIAIVSLLLMPYGSVSALQPYVAGYSVQTPVKNAAALAMNTYFTGTNLSGIASGSGLLSVLSAAGIASSSDTQPNAFSYQSFPVVFRNGEIQGKAQVWKASISGTNCLSDKVYEPNPAVLASAGTFSNVNYIHHSIGFNDVNKTQYKFVFYVVKTDGSAQTHNLVFAKSSYTPTDTTQFFLVGENVIDSTTKVKFTQFGAENLTENNTGWKIRQKDIFYSTSPTNAVYLSTKPAKSIAYTNPFSTNDAKITWIQSGSTICFPQIGSTEETNAGADYNLKTSTIPKGEVRWFHTTDSTQKISKGTQLWN